MFLLDTNVVSEVRKGDRCDANVAAWYRSIADQEIFLSVLVLGEIRKGIEKARAADRAKGDALARWLQRLERDYAERILSIDTAVADEWGRMSAIRAAPVIDCLLAATAKVNGLTLVTRNAADVSGLGAALLNPFSASGR